MLPSKRHGGYDAGPVKYGCVKIQSPTVPSPTVQDYLTNEFPIYNYDYLLHAVANKSLDRTIDVLGRDLVETQVREFNRLQALAEDYCQTEAIFPCSSEGTSQKEAAAKSCYRRDNGCGYQCVNRVLLQEDQKQQQRNQQEAHF